MITWHAAQDTGRGLPLLKTKEPSMHKPTTVFSRQARARGDASGTELLHCCTRHARCHDRHQLLC